MRKFEKSRIGEVIIAILAGETNIYDIMIAFIQILIFDLYNLLLYEIQKLYV